MNNLQIINLRITKHYILNGRIYPMEVSKIQFTLTARRSYNVFSIIKQTYVFQQKQYGNCYDLIRRLKKYGIEVYDYK